MAENKTSFVLYSDSKSIIDLLTNEQAGLLLKTLFAYVNDENPKIDNSIALVFEMIKLQLKRDLKKWERTKEGRSIAGKASAEAKRLAKLKEFKYYETGDWKDDKGNQVKNWKQKMQSVWFKEENKTTSKPKFISPA